MTGRKKTIARKWDAFISHASEDKQHFLRPLAQALASLGASIWYDEFSLKLGDSLSQSIDRGIARSRYGIVVLSRDFMSKPWTKHELAGLTSLQIAGQSRILPIWHDVTPALVRAFSPTLADKLAVRTADASAIDIALQILTVIRPDLYDKQPRAQLEKMANGEALKELQDELTALRERLSEFQCPYCQSLLVSSIDAPAAPEEKHWDVVRTFECGYSDFGGDKRRLCWKDPAFPDLGQYGLEFEEQEGMGHARWLCSARPKTQAASLLQLRQTLGATREAARKAMMEEYERHAKPWTRPFGDQHE